MESAPRSGNVPESVKSDRSLLRAQVVGRVVDSVLEARHAKGVRQGFCRKRFAAWRLAELHEPGGGILDHFRSEPAPPTLADVARRIDHIRNQILDQGTVVLKQPDIWSQARMTKFRKEFENEMAKELPLFSDYLSAQIARTDAASLQSQTMLGAAPHPQRRVARWP